DGCEQLQDVVGGVLQVGVEDEHVVAGGQGRRGPHGRALAAVDRVLGDHHARVIDAGQDLAGVVDAAVVDNDNLDITRITDVEEPFDGDANGCRLVVGGHQDRQLQPFVPRGLRVWPAG